MLKVIVAGGREFDDYDFMKSKLNELLVNHSDIIIVSGKARGADSLGEKYAKEMGHDVSSHPADWDQYGKRAGYIRNEEMAKEANALVAFWDGKSKGTKHMIELGYKYNLMVRVVKY